MTTLPQLAAALGRVSTTRAVVPVVQASKVAATNVLKQQASGHRHARGLPGAMKGESILGGLGYESGPEARGVGKLENLYYFGSSRMAPQIPDPVIALRAEAPVVERKIADAVCAEIVRRL